MTNKQEKKGSVTSLTLTRKPWRDRQVTSMKRNNNKK